MSCRFAAGSILFCILIGTIGCAAPPSAPKTTPPNNSTGTNASAKPLPWESLPVDGAPPTIDQAIQGNETATVRDLLAKGADPNGKNKEGVPLLFLALDKGSPDNGSPDKDALDIPRALLDKGAKLDVRDAAGETPLMHAVLNSNTAIARLLLDYHAAPNQPDNDGDLPLQMATAQSDVDLVKLLLERGADPHAVDKEGDTPLQIATRDEDTDLIALLNQNHPAPPKSN